MEKQHIEFLRFIQPGAIVPVDMNTTQLLVNALRDAYQEIEGLKQPVRWEEPVPAFYISELSRNTLRHYISVNGRQEFSKQKTEECSVPVWFTPPRPLDETSR